MTVQTVFPLVIVAGLMFAAPSSAQSLRELARTRPISNQQSAINFQLRAGPIDRERERQDREALNTASWVYVATAAADWSVTAVCAQVRCFTHSETGLFLHGVEDNRVAIPIGLAIDAILLVGTRTVVAPDHPKLARWLLYGLSGARIVYTANKVSDLRQHAVRLP